MDGFEMVDLSQRVRRDQPDDIRCQWFRRGRMVLPMPIEGAADKLDPGIGVIADL
ncbi:hypothetical protein RISK_001284 [Rhodopirellula islandica]|uniref:Uncharacterized protein n=1 Tax=Rhodopirellula islandica TaxID=595434 RepID=A0A0J1BJI9_RHOIS|nr:hypothetical protein RISK_001284 [Rhodopirellula islandica]